MKNKKQAIIPNREQNGSKVAENDKKKVVYGLTIDLSSLPKDIRKEIFKEILPK